MAKPNIIIFNPDQMRADSLAHLGNEASYTPNFDNLEKEGTSFSKAFCQNPVCVPSRCSFMTGLYPHVHGHRTMEYLLRKGEENLFLDMKNEGYYTISSTRGDLLSGDDEDYNNQCVDEFIKFNVANKKRTVFLGNRGEVESDRFFSFYDGIIPTKTNDEIAINLDDLTIDGAISSIKARPKDKPFFMFVGLTYPHPPYQIEEKFLNLIKKDKLPKRIPTLTADDQKPSMEVGLKNELGVSTWSETRFNDLRAVYLAMCAKVDFQLGQILTALKEEGIYDDTAILCFSDHGDYTGDFGIVEKAQNCFPDCLTNVPLVIKPPKNFKLSSGINENLVELIDIPATCADFGGFSLKRDQFGKSLVSMMKDKTLKARAFVFSEGGRLPHETCAMEFQEDTFNPLGHYAKRQKLQSLMPQHTKATMIRSDDFKYVKRLFEKDEFYNLSDSERVNQIDNPKFEQQISFMKEQLLNWYMATCDVLPQDVDSRFTFDFILNNMRANGMTEKEIDDFSRSLKASGRSVKEFVFAMLNKH